VKKRFARVFNALSLAAESRAAGDQVEVSFRRPLAYTLACRTAKLGHPANELYSEVRDVIVGASCACAAVFGANGKPRGMWRSRTKKKVCTGRPLAEGWQVLVF